MKKSVGRWLVAVPLITWIPAVLAETPAEGDALAEVVVTAQKRAESLQTVPLSITTFGTQELKDRAVENFMDYATSVPNLGFGASGDGAANSRTISIRGVSGDNTTGFYIDETPVPVPGMEFVKVRVSGRLTLGTWQSVCLVDLNVDNPVRQVRLSFLPG